jgi:8-oxo-dGDP phosphatase
MTLRRMRDVMLHGPGQRVVAISTLVDAGEDGAGTAAREVEEETGWRPGPMTQLLSFQPMIGMVDTPHELYVAHGAQWVGDPTDLEESGRVDWLPMAQILDLINKGEILGSGSLVALSVRSRQLVGLR